MFKGERTFDQTRADMIAEFALPGEEFLFNVTSDPRDPKKRTLKQAIQRLQAEQPDKDLRFDFDHVVVMEGGRTVVLDGKEFARRFCGIKKGDGAAVYAKPKTK